MSAFVLHTGIEDHGGADKTNLSVVETETVEDVSKLELINEKFTERHLVHQVTIVIYINQRHLVNQKETIKRHTHLISSDAESAPTPWSHPERSEGSTPAQSGRPS